MEIPKNTSRSWAEINLNNLAFNFTQIRQHVKAILPEAKVLGVVKADAYGHGAVQTAQTLVRAGADFLAVATALEGVELREAGIALPILVLGYVGDEDVPLLLRYDIAAALCDRDNAAAFSRAAQAAGKPVRVHIALNTGMTRIGFETRSTKEDAREILQALALPGIQAEGAFTHFAVADVDGGEEFTELQYRRFVDMCQELEQHGVHLRYRHCANSAAILQHSQTFTTGLYRDGAFNMVRAGIILYGYYPDATTKKTVPLKPVMTVKSRVVQVREVPAGDSIGYGRTYTADKPLRVAVFAMGYADGYPRCVSNRISVVVGGKVVPCIGRICMDMAWADVSGLDVRRGDEVVIFGEGPVTADTLADAAGTISYEILCDVGKRVPRLYLE
ncbi:MAG TPA: alanine racemase [Candidatus Butyricicoccus stercorigallinarum]|nr:alanine racemase [Candidatus Butyricicoccus stercorigallinarum]